MPTRSRGVLGGLTGLILGPIVAVLLAQGGGLARAQLPARLSSVTVSNVAVVLPYHEEAADSVRDASTAAATSAPATRRPAPSPTVRPAVRAQAAPPVPLPAPGTIAAIIKAAADAHGVSYPWMLKIAMCESTLNPRAYNPIGPFIGLFQFLPSTFAAHGGTDIYDPVQQANIAADMLAHGYAWAWACA